MKRMKKIVSILLAMVMVLGMSLTVFATEGGGDVTTPDTSSTPDGGSRSGTGDDTETPESVTHTYEIYQIFTGDYADGILSNIKWGTDRKSVV